MNHCLNSTPSPDRGRGILAWCLALASALRLLCAGDAGAAERLAAWEWRQDIQVTGSGALRMTLPPEALSLCQPGLGDLRLADAFGQELSYGLVQLESPPVEPVAARRFDVTLTRQSTVVEVETGLDQGLDGIRLLTSSPRFHKAVRVEGSNDRREWETLAEGTPFFRIPEEGVERLVLGLPARRFAFLRLTLDDRRSPAIVITGASVKRAGRDPVPLETLPLRVVERIEGAGESRLTLDLGAANLFLDSLALQTSEALFNREISLIVRELEQGVVRERVLASGRVFRLSGGDEPVATRLELGLRQRIAARRVDLVIRNQDSPPLPVTSVSGQRLPDQLVCSLPQPGTYSLYSGNREAAAPRYDLGAIGGVQAGRLPLASARFSPPVANPAFARGDAIPDFPALGSVLAVPEWRFRKPVRLSGAGVHELELDLECLSGAQPGLEDVRLMSGDHQVPFLTEYSSLTRAVVPAVTDASPKDRPGVTRWRLELPAARLPLIRMLASSSTTLFQRDLRLWEEAKGSDGNVFQRDLARVHWVRTPSSGKEGLSLALQTPPSGSVVFLETDNGDNAPLELHDLRFLHAVTRLVFRPAGGAEVRLYYGNPRAAAPRYDLSLVAGPVLRSERSAASLGAEERLKGAAGGGWGPGAGNGVMLFWAVLILVVVALLVILTRLVPKPPPPAT